VRRLFFLAVGTGLFLTMTANAYAYLDPVTGSFILQGLIGSLVAAIATLRSVRQRIVQIFRPRKVSRAPKTDEGNTPA
jgi:hypothetical protein